MKYQDICGEVEALGKYLENYDHLYDCSHIHDRLEVLFEQKDRYDTIARAKKYAKNQGSNVFVYVHNDLGDWEYDYIEEGDFRVSGAWIPENWLQMLIGCNGEVLEEYAN